MKFQKNMPSKRCSRNSKNKNMKFQNDIKFRNVLSYEKEIWKFQKIMKFQKYIMKFQQI